jgi:hypothetical protein
MALRSRRSGKKLGGAQGMRFGRETWSVQLSGGWEAWQDTECASMEPPTRLGALQVSAAFKESFVSDEDLRDFAGSEAQTSVDSASFGPFVGFHLAHESEGAHWHRWYLRHESQALFVTYNCPLPDRGLEDAAVIEVLKTLSTQGVTPHNQRLERSRP